MAINLRDVKFAYHYPKKKEPRYILKDINLNIEGQDEFIVVVGKSGAGKSTLVQLFNGLLLTNEGEVDIFGKKISNKKNISLKDVRKKVGLVFQFPEYQLFEETILKDVSFGPKNFGVSNYEEVAKRALNMVGIGEELYETSPFSLSGGQQRRVAIAGILASNPDVLVFDEPTVGLDPVGKQELLSLLKEINEVHHKTIIFITHDMEVVAEAAKRVIVLKNGSITFDGDKDCLFKNEEMLKEYSLDLPNVVKVLKRLKKELNLNINEYQYNIDDAYSELRRVLSNE